MTNPTDDDRPDAEVVARIDEALLRMPKLRRNIFLLRHLDDLSYDEIAQAYGISKGRVERQFVRAVIDLCRYVDNDTRPWWRKLPGRFR